MKLERLPPPDSFHVQAAEGWLELGNPPEARSELNCISVALKDHPDALELAWKIFAAENAWEQAVEAAAALARVMPEHASGWIHWAYSLHELKRTRKAQEVLQPMADNFPDDYIIRYNLACYACQLGNLPEARQWLGRAAALAGKKKIRALALDDPDLEPLRDQISGM
jgi:predicted Zn-dependent protease